MRQNNVSASETDFSVGVVDYQQKLRAGFLGLNSDSPNETQATRGTLLVTEGDHGIDLCGASGGN
jgi:hypothetical protein